MTVHYYFLHGFLGRPSDWDRCILEMSDSSRFLPVKVDILALTRSWVDRKTSLAPWPSLTEWGVEFNAWVQKSDSFRRVLVGYSMGARLAMHAFFHSPELWSHCVVISGHGGLHSVEERMKRQKEDEAWAQKFLTQNWQAVLRMWNDQPVFKNSQEPCRLEEHYHRQELFHCLTQWSLSQQESFWDAIFEQRSSLTWVIGAKDSKFFKLSRELMVQIPELHCVVESEASHRVIFDAPQSLGRILSSFRDE